MFHAPTLGKYDLHVKTKMPEVSRHYFDVSKKASAALSILAVNLERLMGDGDGRLTQQAVAKLAKVDQKSISRILRKEHEPTVDKVAKLAKAFGLEAWQILTPDLEPNHPPMLASQSAALKKMFTELTTARKTIDAVLEGKS